jgi:hypothetical protein
MARYIKRFKSLSSAGPTEERGFAIWAGYDIVGVDADLSAQGLLNVEGWSDEELAARGVIAFLRVEPADAALYAKLGIEREGTE